MTPAQKEGAKVMALNFGIFLGTMAVDAVVLNVVGYWFRGEPVEMFVDGIRSRGYRVPDGVGIFLMSFLIGSFAIAFYAMYRIQTSRRVCPNCGRREARMVSQKNSDIYLQCSACDFCEPTGLSGGP